MAGYDFRRYLNVRTATGPSFSPDGTRLCFLSDVTGVPQVWSVPVESGWPDQLTFYAERISEAHVSPVADEVLFAMDAGGNERHALFLLRRNGAQITPLTNAPDAIHQFGGWSWDGLHIAYAANTRDQAFFDVYVDTPHAPEPRRVLQHDGTNYALGWTYQGHVLVGRYYTNLHNALFAVDAPDWDVEELALSRDGRRLAYTVNVDGFSELRLRDTETGALLHVPPLPRATYSQLAWSRDGRRLALVLNGARYNPDVWVLDLQEERTWQVTHSARGGIPQEDLVEPEVIRYPTFDGRQIPALFFPPQGRSYDAGLPVVVEVHGGPESQRRPVWSAVIQYLAGRGYAVLSPNVRGSTGYGKAYTHLDDVRLRMDAVRDLAHAVEWLHQNSA